MFTSRPTYESNLTIYYKLKWCRWCAGTLLKACWNKVHCYSTYYEDICIYLSARMYVSQMEGVHILVVSIRNWSIALDISGFIEKVWTEQPHYLWWCSKRSYIQLSFLKSFLLLWWSQFLGKTTIIKALSKGFQLGGLGRIILCAHRDVLQSVPGRGRWFEATTIHRPWYLFREWLLDFTKSEDDPLNMSMEFISSMKEASMLNVRLFILWWLLFKGSPMSLTLGDIDKYHLWVLGSY